MGTIQGSPAALLPPQAHIALLPAGSKVRGASRNGCVSWGQVGHGRASHSGGPADQSQRMGVRRVLGRQAWFSIPGTKGGCVHLPGGLLLRGQTAQLRGASAVMGFAGLVARELRGHGASSLGCHLGPVSSHPSPCPWGISSRLRPGTLLAENGCHCSSGLLGHPRRPPAAGKAGLSPRTLSTWETQWHLANDCSWVWRVLIG